MDGPLEGCSLHFVRQQKLLRSIRCTDGPCILPTPPQTMNLLGLVGICPVSPRPPRRLRSGTGLRSRIPTGCSESNRSLMRYWLPRPCPDLVGQPLAGYQIPFCGLSILSIPLLWREEFVNQSGLHMGVLAWETLPLRVHSRRRHRRRRRRSSSSSASGSD